jgi:hypothetical protein
MRPVAMEWRVANNNEASAAVRSGTDIVYWHRDLPPLDANVVDEHTIEAVSVRVPGTIAHRDELWDICYRDLMQQTTARLVQEVDRLEGRFAHVLEESIDSRHDDRSGESWLHGRFRYALLR